MKYTRAFTRCLLLSCSLLVFGSIFQPAHAAEEALTLEERVAQLESAAQPDDAASAVDTGDNAWMLISCGMVLMMTAPGLILFYGGLVRSKNVLPTMIHSLVIMGVMSLIWMIYGYSLAFGEGNAFFGNPLQYLFLKGVLFTVVLAGVGTYVILKIVNATVGLRVDREEEALGLDLTQHGERAYND